MSLLAKIVIFVIVVAGLGFGGVKYSQMSKPSDAYVPEVAPATTTPSQASLDEAAAHDTSDAALSSDLSSIDSSISASASAAASVNDTVSDKPVAQTQ